MRHTALTLLALLLVPAVGCDWWGGDDSYSDDEGYYGGDEGGDLSGGYDSCILGFWERSICDGNEWATMGFQDDGTGFWADYDCTGQCYRTADFTWSQPNDGVLTFVYTRFRICDVEQPVEPGSQSFSCSGNTMDLGGQVYTRSN